MKLLDLRLANFRVHADTEIAFPERGITGLVGSNESGKSTVLEAVAWAIYGARAVRGTKGSIRWNRAPARHTAAVELRLEVGGVRYRIERTESNAKVFIDGQPKPVAEGTSAVDGYMPERVGMTLEEFASTYMTSQRDLHRIAAMGPTERRQFILGVLGVGRIDEALANCRSRKNELAREETGLRAGLGERDPLAAEAEEAKEAETRAFLNAETAGALRDDRQKESTRRAADLAEQDERKLAHERLERERADAEKDAAAAARDLEYVGKQIERAEGATARLKESEKLLETLPGLRARRDSLHEASSLAETIAGLEAEVARLTEEEGALTATMNAFDEVALQVVVERFREAEGRLDILKTERVKALVTAKAEMAAAADARKKVERQIQMLREAGEDGACPTCTRPLGEHLAGVLSALESAATTHRAAEQRHARDAQKLMDPGPEESDAAATLEKLRADGERLKAARAAAQEAEKQRGNIQFRLEAKRNELDRRRQRMAGLGETPDPAGLAKIEADIAELDQLERGQVREDRALADRLDDLLAQSEQLDDRRAQAAKAHQDAVAAIVDLAFDLDVWSAAAQIAIDAQRRLQEAREDAARKDEAAKAAEQRRREAEARLASYDTRAADLRELTAELRRHERAAERLADFRAAQASSIRPELEELTSGFVSLLTEGRHESVTIDDDFKVVLQESGLDVEVVSGGTEDIAAIALRLAISQMIAERAGHPLSLLVLDEPFGSLDEVRRGAVLALIRRLGGIFSQVIVISHVAETRDAVDHTIELEYDEAAGCSRVTSQPIAAAPEAEAA